MSSNDQEQDTPTPSRLNPAIMTKTRATFEKIIPILDKKIQDGFYDFMHQKPYGVRSRQISALIHFLIEIGVIDDHNFSFANPGEKIKSKQHPACIIIEDEYQETFCKKVDLLLADGFEVKGFEGWHHKSPGYKALMVKQ